MSDEKTIAVIQLFKSALINNSIPSLPNSKILDSNRGNKLEDSDGEDDERLSTKVVGFNGAQYVVSSNKKIDSISRRKRHKWSDYYKNTEEYKRTKLDNSDEDDSQTSDSSSDDENDDVLDELDLTAILLPLGHPSEVFTHPAISKTYKLEVLSKLALDLIDLIEVEQTTLNSFNKLLQVLNGEDWYFLLEENLGLPSYDHGLVNEEDQDQQEPQGPSSTGATSITSGSVEGEKKDEEEAPKRITRTSNPENDQVSDPFFQLPETLRRYEAHQARIVDEPEPGKENELNNIKEDLINYLQVSIQRQQEHIKNLMKLRNNIVRAQRLKEDLLKWGKEMHDKRSS